MFWEENFAPARMTSCGRRNVRKHRDFNKDEQYIILEISSKIHCLYNSEATSSESSDYMGRPGKGVTTYLDPREKIQTRNKKQGLSLLILISRIVGRF